jgi:eukaryotic-like serine/threonine-protein kinase
MERKLYSSQSPWMERFYWKPSDGSGAEELLASNEGGFSNPVTTPDGKWLAYHEGNPKTKRDIEVLPLEGERKPRILLRESYNESAPAFSPDGHWLAYVSDESGESQVYVRFKGHTNQMVSAAGRITMSAVTVSASS